VELVRTKRILVRRWEEDDLPEFFALYSREDVMRWLGPHPRRALASMAEAHERLERSCAQARELDPPLGRWAIVPLDSGTPARPVGTIPFLPVPGDAGLIEVAWHLHPQHQGQGLATEAARAVLDAARQAGIGEVLALTDLDNVASQAVATRLGMRYEGVTQRWFGLTMHEYRKVLSGSAGAVEQ
jgi:RimJ/RimL family protein N-acetyltransferase